MKTARNASDCVGKQPIMVATAMTEHSYWLQAQQSLAFLAVFIYAKHTTQAIAFQAFGWKPGFSRRHNEKVSDRSTNQTAAVSR